jgi:3-deoxy-D-manno-octulosonic-acid transferase
MCGVAPRPALQKVLPTVLQTRGNRPEPRLVYWIYSLLMAIAALLLTPYWVVQGLRHGKYLSNLGERLGFSYPALQKIPDLRGSILLHAVSVGEVLSGITLARKLKDAYPHRRLIISTTTITGQALARERMPFADAVIYFPLDWNFCVQRALNRIQPALVIILETEIWPNFLRQARHREIPVIFISGRISDGSFARYQKYFRTFGFFLRPFLKSALSNPSLFLMQSEKDAERIRFLGAPTDRVQASGNLKYDQELAAPIPLSNWLTAEAQRIGRSPIIVAGSVVATEEPLALIAFGTLQGEYPNALLVLAPRKPERFDAAAEFIHESRRKFLRRSELSIQNSANGLSAAASSGAVTSSATVSNATTASATSSTSNEIPKDVTVLLVDSIGELASLYRCADGVFVGGSLVPSGGHNILEPAAFGKIPVFGPSMENFSEMAARFVAAGAAVQVESPEDAGVAWIEFFRDPERMRTMGETARALVADSRGATDRALVAISSYLGERDAPLR